MMKTLKVILFGILAVISAMCTNRNPSVTQLSDEIKITEVEQNVFLITHSFPWPGNSLVVVSDRDNIVWVDTPYTPDATSAVLDWIRNKFGGSRVITEINTGFHIDNLGGNQELIKRNITIYGSGLTRELIKTRSKMTMSKMLQWLDGSEFEKYRDVYFNFEFHCPTRIFDINEEQIISLGSEEVIVHYPGPTHTYDNIVVYFPQRKLLFGGCMILSSEADKPGFIEDGDLDEWAKSLLNLEKRFGHCRMIVPGHGNPGDFGLIDHTKKIISAATKPNNNIQ